MITVYIREKTGNRAFLKAPATPGPHTYWLRYTENGKPKWKRVGEYAGVAKAIRLLERQEVAKEWGLSAPTEIGRLSIPEAVERFIQRKITAGKRPATIEAYTYTLGLFQEFCPVLYLDQITGDVLLDFAAWCKKRGDGERTVHNRFVDLTTFMKFHGKPKLVEKTDWPKYVERPVESYSQDELDKFYAAATTDKERLLLDLLIHSGFRIGEIAHLCYSDVDFTKNRLNVTPKPRWDWKPKTNECRTVRVPSRVTVGLLQWKDKHPGELVFPTRANAPDEHLLRIVDDLAERAGITGRYDCHKFRATFATRKSGEGHKPQDIQRMLGHKNITTTMRYLAVTDLDDEEFVKKIEAA